MNAKSIEKLKEIDERLQKLVLAIDAVYPIEVVCGHRNEADQNEAFRTGHTKVKWPDGKHNKEPSLAVDIVPTATYYADIRAFYFIYGIAVVKAKELGIIFRCGCDWDGDFNFINNKFNDLVHYELVTP